MLLTLPGFVAIDSLDVEGVHVGIGPNGQVAVCVQMIGRGVAGTKYWIFPEFSQSIQEVHTTVVGLINGDSDRDDDDEDDDDIQPFHPRNRITPSNN